MNKLEISILFSISILLVVMAVSVYIFSDETSGLHSFEAAQKWYNDFSRNPKPASAEQMKKFIELNLEAEYFRESASEALNSGLKLLSYFLLAFGGVLLALAIRVDRRGAKKNSQSNS